MRAKNSATISDPGFYDFAVKTAAPIIFKKFNASITENSLKAKDLKTPFILLSNHQSTLDYFFAAASVFPHRLNYVATFYFFCKPLQRKILNKAGAICKMQFISDVSAMKKMIETVKRGGNLAIYPEGQLPFYGKNIPLAKGTQKFIKKMGVPVYFVKMNGSYLSSPKWAKHRRRGKVEITLSELLSVQEIEKLTEKEILKKTEDAVEYNEYLWQKENKVKFCGRDLAKNLEFILPVCKNCKARNTLITHGNVLECANCKSKWTIDEYSIIKSEKEVENILSWHTFQHNFNVELTEKENFLLTDITKISFSNVKKLKKEFISNGEISMNKEKIWFTYFPDKCKTTLEFNIKNIPTLPNVAGVNFEIATKEGVFTFDLENGRNVFTWVDCCEILNKKITKGE